MNRKSVFKIITDYFFICVGLAIFAFGWTAFLIPQEITGGGVNGIAALVYFATQTIPVGVTVLILNLLLVAAAWKVLGRKFCVNTLISSAILSLFLSIGQMVFTKPLVDDMFMCAILGPILSGVGVGIVMNYGGNTGGTDIIALMIGKYRNISYGRVTLYFNLLIICSSYFVVKDGVIEKLVYSLVTMFVYTFVADTIIDGFRQTYQFFVFSSKNHEIAKRINSELHRGATFLKGVGSFSQAETEVLLIIAHRTDKVRIIQIIKEIDDNSFISISKANSVFGKNFDKIKL